MTNFSPREIVSELDRFIVGQKQAKRAVAIALRNRWRRQQLEGPMREEVLPKNILMIGPTGVGKTEISRRLAKLAGAPFIKVEATKFTEVGYVGRDVEQMIRDLVEAGIALVREEKRKSVRAKAEMQAEERALDCLVGPAASPTTRESFRRRLRAGELDDKEIEIEVRDTGNPMGAFEVPGMPGMSRVGMIPEPLSWTSSSISRPASVPSRSSFLNLSRVSRRAASPGSPRRRSSRSRRPSSPRSATSAATSSRSCATSWSCRSPRPASACARRWPRGPN